jgi:hypothetical protein
LIRKQEVHLFGVRQRSKHKVRWAPIQVGNAVARELVTAWAMADGRGMEREEEREKRLKVVMSLQLWLSYFSPHTSRSWQSIEKFDVCKIDGHVRSSLEQLEQFRCLLIVTLQQHKSVFGNAHGKCTAIVYPLIDSATNPRHRQAG